ncbi:hypothetical protein EJ06DRAFT_427682 [Trichodelitschia bisporula]|uniref:C2H2-type domain-containing protein n=1 Tax=Trichodelitschia bisporula TaxID=703511 RepID=A0A6G1HX12_9PEZI|nr:hypothetical protein EJ06DRAFT_427682 [Trichodelitschia bisporula]
MDLSAMTRLSFNSTMYDGDQLVGIHEGCQQRWPYQHPSSELYPLIQEIDLDKHLLPPTDLQYALDVNGDRGLGQFYLPQPLGLDMPDGFQRHPSPSEESASSLDSQSAAQHEVGSYLLTGYSSHSISRGTWSPELYQNLAGHGSGGDCIALSDVQEFAEPEPSYKEELPEPESNHVFDYQHLLCRPPRPPTPPHEDEGLGDSALDDENSPPTPMVKDESDREWKPSGTAKRSKRKPISPTAGRPAIPCNRTAPTGSSTMGQHGVKKSKSKKLSVQEKAQPFPCVLARYGCFMTFTSKNEWKRHVRTKHIQLERWRCDLCSPGSDHLNPVYNDFNRKDLFTQHVRRLHNPNPPLANGDLQKVPEDVLIQLQERCHEDLRTNPPFSRCPQCEQRFGNDYTWDALMEHLGGHYEERKKNPNKGSYREDKVDPVLERWLYEEGLIVKNEDGEWKIGDGIPLRHLS